MMSRWTPPPPRYRQGLTSPGLVTETGGAPTSSTANKTQAVSPANTTRPRTLWLGAGAHGLGPRGHRTAAVGGIAGEATVGRPPPLAGASMIDRPAAADMKPGSRARRPTRLPR